MSWNISQNCPTETPTSVGCTRKIWNNAETKRWKIYPKRLIKVSPIQIIRRFVIKNYLSLRYDTLSLKWIFVWFFSKSWARIPSRLIKAFYFFCIGISFVETEKCWFLWFTFAFSTFCQYLHSNLIAKAKTNLRTGLFRRKMCKRFA